MSYNSRVEWAFAVCIAPCHVCFMHTAAAASRFYRGDNQLTHFPSLTPLCMCACAMQGRNFSLMETSTAWESADVAATEREPGDWGERKTELVLIGLNLDEAVLRAELEACLLSDGELAAHEEAVRATQAQWRRRRAHRNPSLRFDVGEMVECFLGSKGGWTRGQVVMHDWRQDDWPADKVMAYQVQLSPENVDESGSQNMVGVLVFAPVDADTCIRAHSKITPEHKVEL